MKESLVIFAAVFATYLIMNAPVAAQNKMARPKPVYVYLNFEGDPDFPSITKTYNTQGLARFTGSAFRLSEQDRGDVLAKIIQYLREDYAEFNVDFVTDPTGLDQFYTWGIDDSFYTYPNGGVDVRLWGKAGGNPSLLIDVDIATHDDDGNLIWHPKHARTFAGSYALTPGSDDESEPALIPRQYCSQDEISDWHCGQFWEGGPIITVDHVAWALANSAAHEIAHLFGAVHTTGNDLMHAQIEKYDGRKNKDFAAGARAIFGGALGEPPRLVDNADGTVTDTRAGLMWARDANLPKRFQSSCSGGPSYGGSGSGQLAEYEANGYVNCLDYAGYGSGWRLPDARNFDASGPCLDQGHLNMSCEELQAYVGCADSEFGLLYYTTLQNLRGNTSCIYQPPVYNAGPFIHIDHDFTYGFDYYWTDTDQPPDAAWLFDFHTGEQFPLGDHFQYFVWPVRDAYRLVDNGDGTVTDTSTGLMWANDPYLAGSKMSWSAASDWAANLSYAGYSDWRLPTTQAPDATCDDVRIFSGRTLRVWNCTRSELGHLTDRWGITSSNPGPFNLPFTWPYTQFWSQTEWAPDPANRAWTVIATLSGGLTYNAFKDIAEDSYAWVVRDSQPGATPPGTDVRLRPRTDVLVTFGQVTAKGATMVHSTQQNPGPDSSVFQFLGTFHEITTTASFTGGVQVCLTYDETALPTGTEEQNLKILRWEESEWADITRGSYPDVINNLICGRSSSLSWFALAASGGDGAGPGTGCFITVAATGSYLANDLVRLREFRDDYLMTNPFGRRVVALYARYSPSAARYLATHESARIAARLALTPLVYGLKYPIPAAMAAIVFIVVLRRCSKRLGQAMSHRT